MCFPLNKSNRTVPKLKITLSGVTLPEKKTHIINETKMQISIDDHDNLMKKTGEFFKFIKSHMLSSQLKNRQDCSIAKC